MTHHVLHVDRDAPVPVLVDLATAPGRTVVFTRTKHGAKALARQLNKQRRARGRAARQPRPERPHPQHGRRSTPARPRTLVATDIAARGIHVDDVGARRPRRPAGRAQGLPAPLRPYGARRQRRHRRHPDDRRAGPRRPRPDPQGRHQADHHPDQRLRPPGAASSSPPASARSSPPRAMPERSRRRRGRPRWPQRRRSAATPAGGRGRGRGQGSGNGRVDARRRQPQPRRPRSRFGAAGSSGGRPHSAASFSSNRRSR